MITTTVHPLKARVTDLVAELRRSSTLVRSGDMDLPVAAQWFLEIRPSLELAAKEISAYLPERHPSITIEAQFGNLRRLKYDLYDTIVSGPMESLVDTQMDIIANALERDLAYVN